MDKRDMLRNGISEKLEIGAELVTGVHRLVLTGQERLLLENHGGILGFSASKVTVRVKAGALEISGGALKLPLLTADTLEIVGSIQSVAFIKE